MAMLVITRWYHQNLGMAQLPETKTELPFVAVVKVSNDSLKHHLPSVI